MIDYLKTLFGAAIATAIIIAIFCIAPLLLFWSIDTLFGVVIPFTFWTWLAAMILIGMIKK